MKHFQRVKGTRDFISGEANLLRHIGGEMCSVLKRYGGILIITPALEELDVLRAKSGPNVVNQIYAFKDKGNREIGLRFDNTVSAARIAANYGKKISKPFKFYYFDNYWRYEKPQLDRFREFFHVGLECFGSPNPIADAEVIACFNDCYREVGLDKYHISINNRKIIEGYLENIGISEDNILEIFRIIDKRTNYTKETYKIALFEAGLPPREFASVQELINLSGSYETLLSKIDKNDKISGNNKSSEGIRELWEIFELLKNYDAINRCKLDFGLARGFDYYTGLIFECIYPNPYGIGSIGGGGRYDNLVKIFHGESTEATGFSIGIDRTILILEKEGLMSPREFDDKVEFFIVIKENNLISKAIKLACSLRMAGFSVDFDLRCRKINKQMSVANKRGAQHVVVVGEKEIEQNYLSILNLKTGEKSRSTLEELLLNYKHREDFQ